MYRDLSVFSGNAHRALAQAVCEYIDVPLGKAEVFEFKNENIFVKINQVVREHDVFVIQPFCSPVNKSIMELLIMLDALKRASAGRITAVIPYFAYARTDKKDQPRVPITARLLADMITVAGANRVLTLDLHAGQVQGFFSIPVDELTAYHLLERHWQQRRLTDMVVVSADIGFAKKARNFAAKMHAPLAIIEKRRLGNAGISESLTVIGDVRGKTALIVDDEIDSGGSMVGAAKVLKEQGVTDVYATAVHGVLSGSAVEKIQQSDIKELVITDTIRLDPPKLIPKITQLSVGSLLGETIRRIHTGTSVGSMFGE
ncbi:MAG: ribose-phosphate diphosphokinase [Chloroflexota bacterium]